MPRTALAAGLAAAALVTTAQHAGAQHAERLRVGARPPGPAVDSQPPHRAPPPGAAVLRTGGAILGWAGGAYTGAYVGYGFRKHTGGDFEGFGEALLGAMAGGVVGAAAGAALPELGSRCETGRRFGRAIGGAALGGAAGLVGLGFGGWPALLTVPIGSVVGATAGAHGCRPAGS
ncbi:hypothetical protein J421_1492 [Gemmatirosa kalamazoonensis]|uniref:Uncharacterized protein n=1 Tax=Gemmatirosa kalamazoonensis TaxID=861299 RepID=W0RD24_9BACT|nr:hypothetical protein [Gemmatirosa kalamazoonensis]AHG89029.1 hypothetical protein J421_1492 [Gemmatirosa kalamazoonensis]